MDTQELKRVLRSLGLEPIAVGFNVGVVYTNARNLLELGVLIGQTEELNGLDTAVLSYAVEFLDFPWEEDYTPAQALMRKIDWALLDGQKQWLLFNPDSIEARGLIHLIDGIQAAAVGEGLHEDLVYPKDTIYGKEG